MKCFSDINEKLSFCGYGKVTKDSSQKGLALFTL